MCACKPLREFKKKHPLKNLGFVLVTSVQYKIYYFAIGKLVKVSGLEAMQDMQDVPVRVVPNPNPRVVVQALQNGLGCGAWRVEGRYPREREVILDAPHLVCWEVRQ